MKIILVAVRDEAVQAFGNPWCAQTVNMALRHFGDACGNPDDNNQWRKHPQDFFLYQVGEFENTTGVLSVLEIPVRLGSASEFVR
ncbi:nonstructural protein [robinz microvirus RP_97]|nr:nonstructural protein [robinz microvirus RP_97]